jgi:ankyrin repeat protein
MSDDARKPDATREELLRLACYVDDVDRIQSLASAGTNVNARDADGFGALHAGAAAGSTRAVRLLLQLGADPNA